MRALGWLVVLLVAASGCAAKPKETASASPSPTGDVLPAGVTNRLEGTVKTIDLQPLARANVSLQGTAMSTLTDEAGRYQFESLPPKDFIVVASLDGYRTKTQRAVIEDDRIFELDFVLEAVPSARPYAETKEFRGLISCQLEYQTAPDNQNRPGCAAVDSNNQPSKTFSVGAGAANIFVEVDWVPRTAASQVLTLTVSSIGEDAVVYTYQYGPAVLRAPIAETVVRKSLSNGGEVRVLLESGPSLTGDEASVDAGVALQQDFHVYFTTFYYEAGPPSFSALPPP